MCAVAKPASSMLRSTSSTSRAPFEAVRLDQRPAGVAGQGRSQDVVTALQGGQDELPGAPGVGEAVQADQRRSGAAPV